MPVTKFRNWCFTINNPTDEDRESLIPMKSFNHDPPVPTLPSGVKYIKFQLERGKEGTPHFQGVVVFKSQVVLKSVKKLMPRAHLEPCRDLRSSLIYCEKEDTRVDGPWSHGQEPAQGARTDLVELCESISSGEVTAEAVAVESPMTYHKYGRTLHKVEDIALRKRFRTEMTKGIWLYGPTGVGKSHRAFKDFDPSTHYVWKNDKGWQDGYTGQEIVIINDFRGSIPYDELLQMVDKWPYTVPRRGREPAPFLAKQVIITSSLSPEEVYWRRAEGDSIDQLTRRFEVEHLLGGHSITPPSTSDPKLLIHFPTDQKFDSDHSSDDTKKSCPEIKSPRCRSAESAARLPRDPFAAEPAESAERPPTMLPDSTVRSPSPPSSSFVTSSASV